MICESGGSGINMDILTILQESGKNLYPEDLDFFETELATGGPYDEAYAAQCRDKIKKLRAWLNDDKNKKTTAENNKKKESAPKSLFVGIGDLAPKDSNPIAASLTPEQMILNDIAVMRNIDSYKTVFKKTVAGKAEINADFVEKHFSFFLPWEIDAILTVKQLGEDFLEKYFGALDHDKIARYQLFSETFFMKHYSQLDASVVLEHGKNEWRKKENRSRQLDVFLRLKGVKV